MTGNRSKTARRPTSTSSTAAPRASCPVHHSDQLFGGFWAILSHDAVVDAALDTATFSNVVPLLATRRPPLESDPPEHPIFRRLMNPYFSRDRIASMEPIVRGFAAEMDDDAILGVGGRKSRWASVP
jgi:cytochrome P450